MKLCTDKVVADWLALTPKRVKQLRDEGVLIEKSRGCTICGHRYCGM